MATADFTRRGWDNATLPATKPLLLWSAPGCTLDVFGSITAGAPCYENAGRLITTAGSYTGGDDDLKITAYNSATGALLWASALPHTESNRFSLPVGISSKGSIVAMRFGPFNDNGKIHFLNPATGALLASSVAGFQVGDPVTDIEHVLILSDGDVLGVDFSGGNIKTLRKVDGLTGATTWSLTPTTGSQGGIYADRGPGMAEHPSDGTVFVAYIEGEGLRIITINRATGVQQPATVWSPLLDPRGRAFSGPAQLIADTNSLTAFVSVSSGPSFMLFYEWDGTALKQPIIRYVQPNTRIGRGMTRDGYLTLIHNPAFSAGWPGTPGIDPLDSMSLAVAFAGTDGSDTSQRFPLGTPAVRMGCEFMMHSDVTNKTLIWAEFFPENTHGLQGPGVLTLLDTKRRPLWRMYTPGAWTNPCMGAANGVAINCGGLTFYYQASGTGSRRPSEYSSTE